MIHSFRPFTHPPTSPLRRGAVAAAMAAQVAVAESEIESIPAVLENASARVAEMQSNAYCACRALAPHATVGGGRENDYIMNQWCGLWRQVP